MDERDPGADTAMFRAYVEHGDTAEEQTSANRTVWIAAGAAAVVVLILVALLAL